MHFEEQLFCRLQTKPMHRGQLCSNVSLPANVRSVQDWVMGALCLMSKPQMVHATIALLSTGMCTKVTIYVT